MTFFFDNNHSPKIVVALRQGNVDVIHLKEAFPDRSLDDVDWIPMVAERGWIVITGDHRMRTRKAEKVVFRAAGLITFFVSKEYNNKHALKQIQWIVTLCTG